MLKAADDFSHFVCRRTCLLQRRRANLRDGGILSFKAAHEPIDCVLSLVACDLLFRPGLPHILDPTGPGRSCSLTAFFSFARVSW